MNDYHTIHIIFLSYLISNSKMLTPARLITSRVLHLDHLHTVELGAIVTMSLDSTFGYNQLARLDTITMTEEYSLVISCHATDKVHAILLAVDTTHNLDIDLTLAARTTNNPATSTFEFAVNGITLDSPFMATGQTCDHCDIGIFDNITVSDHHRGVVEVTQLLS